METAKYDWLSKKYKNIRAIKMGVIDKMKAYY